MVFSLCSGAYHSEYIRGAILSIKKGQFQAAKALGFSPAQTFWTIVIPQAVRRAWPGCGNEVVYLIKYSSLAMILSAKELTSVARSMALGLGQGFSGEMRGVQRQIDRSMAGLVAPTMTYGVTAATSAPAYSGGDTIGASVGAAVRSALDGAAVYLNGRKVGNLITQQQNQTAIARGQSSVYI